MVPLIELQRITKRFGALVANEAVDLQVKEGALHAIVGENGAGKTTLMRILYGYYLPDSGEIRLRGNPVHFRSPADAITARIGMVSQHYSIIPELTVLDNLILGFETANSWGLLKRRQAQARATEMAASLDFAPHWSQPASELSPAEKQKLEILKLLWRNADILILDEPTAMLSPSDTGALFGNLMRLKQEGRTILLVTHKLSEVMQYADYVTVLRDGRKVAESAVADTDPQQLTRWIIGEEEKESEPSETVPTPSVLTSAPVLEISDLWVKGDQGGWALQKFNLQLYPGEILGIAGVDGNGQTELVETLAGLRTPSKGNLKIQGISMNQWSAAKRLQAGIRFLFDDRFRRGMIAAWSVRDNAILGSHRDPDIQSLGWYNHSAVQQRARALIQRFHVKTSGLNAPMSSLSGGNQQRLVIARTLNGSPKALIAYTPTRGLDIKGIESTYRVIREACAEGMAALVVSLDLEELMTYSTRIATIYRGQLTRAFTPEEFSREQIGAAMIGLEA